MKRFLAFAVVCGLLLPVLLRADSGSDARARIEPMARALRNAASDVSDKVLTAQGKIADAVLPDARESLYGRFETATGALHETASVLDRDPATRNIEFQKQLNGVKVMARAIETELAGGGFTEAAERFNTGVKPVLSSIEREFPAITAAR